MRIICEVCKQEGYLQQLGNYFRVKHYQGKSECGRSKFFYHQQSLVYVKALFSFSDLCVAGKTLIKQDLYESAEVTAVGVQANFDHQKAAMAGLEFAIMGVRDSPSLVWGRPAKSVVERPRGFNSHIPRHNNSYIILFFCLKAT